MTGFAGAIAALNGLLRTIVNVGPIDWRLRVCVLQRAFTEIVGDKCDQTVYAGTVKARVDDKWHHEGLDGHVIEGEVNKMFQQSQTNE